MNPRLMVAMLALLGCSQTSSESLNPDSRTDSRPYRLVEAHRIDDLGGMFSGALIDRQAGQGISITVELKPEAGTTGLYHVTCKNGFNLLKGDGAAFADQMPSCGSGPYYFGDQYIENPWVMGCLGCDNQWCLELATENTFSTYELIKTGERSPDDSSKPLPVVEVRPTTGPYQLTLTYYTDSKCNTPPLTADPLIIDVH